MIFLVGFRTILTVWYIFDGFRTILTVWYIFDGFRTILTFRYLEGMNHILMQIELSRFVYSLGKSDKTHLI
jgi:hypothetical protein